MAKEDLDAQMKDISEKLRERDEMAAKEAEKAWREAMSKDTALTVMQALQSIQLQMAGLRAELEAANSLVSVLRTINAVVAKITEMNGRLATLEKKVA